MLVDSLEVKDNIRMSKDLSNQDRGDKIDKELELDEQHEQEAFALHFNPSYCEQEANQPSDVLE